MAVPGEDGGRLLDGDIGMRAAEPDALRPALCAMHLNHHGSYPLRPGVYVCYVVRTVTRTVSTGCASQKLARAFDHGRPRFCCWTHRPTPFSSGL